MNLFWFSIGLLVGVGITTVFVITVIGLGLRWNLLLVLGPEDLENFVCVIGLYQEGGLALLYRHPNTSISFEVASPFGEDLSKWK